MGSRTSLNVRQTVKINMGGSSGGLEGLLPLVAVVVVAYIGLSVVAAVVHALTIILIWLMAVAGVGLVAVGVIAFVFRARIHRFMRPNIGDPRDELDRLTAEKREELARIRAMRLQLEAARIAGVEITPEVLRMAEDPELADLVMRFRATVNGTSRYLPVEALESGPRGGEV